MSMIQMTSHPALAVVLLASVGVLAVPPAAAAEPFDVTSPLEAARVDRVKIAINWYDCSKTTPMGTPAECAKVEVPLDYDDPDGPKVKIATMRVRATDQKNKIGTLFVNPGGPAQPGTSLAGVASQFLPGEVLERFDVVGFDPRGVGNSDTPSCFESREQQQQLVGRTIGAEVFPFTAEDRQTWVTQSRAYGVACSTTGTPLVGAMSTAQVARDMDVLRRAVGDDRLTYLGFSYGTYLGNVYASLFPDRVRAIALDSVIDPAAWAGTTETQAVPMLARLKSGEATHAALMHVLDLCTKAGPKRCTFAARGDTVANYRSMLADLKIKPVYDDQWRLTFDYPTFIGLMRFNLAEKYAESWIDQDLTRLWDLIHGIPASRGTAPAPRTGAGQDRLARAFAEEPVNRGDRYADAFRAVLCTDGLNPPDAAAWPAYLDATQAPTEGFGDAYIWSSSACASSTWTVQDEDAYRGPFTRRTSAPILLVGSRWDPATPLIGAVEAARQLPGSRLLTSETFGHGAFSTSCANKAITDYLLTQTLPEKGTVCPADHEPFSYTGAASAKTDVLPKLSSRSLADPGW